ncbi:DUF3530 family protein [Thalassotalea castellviae]|uniref:DUF3530 family protein n=1 Tax=Thalassotalea castellviae TaxID=3075612 RepID=A0ABU2ZYZ5_9GAMM|nr:DUF3530 family protein [Thalassotalea sp. W431]MDT0603145.1 DUF3530 family protein [Thalassotalea sp. W431]
MTRHSLRLITVIFVCFLLPMTNLAAAVQAENNDNKTAEQTTQPKETTQDKQEEASTSETEDETASATKKALRSNIDISAPIDTFINKKNDLEHYLPAEIIQPMLVGPNDHITLVNTNNAISNKGVMILLPDWQQTAASPKALNALRNNLPDQGWTTISILPPNKPNNYPSQAISQTAREEDNNKILTEYQQQLANLVSAVMTKAKSYPGIIVIVAEGHHAALLLNIFQEELAEQPTALIMLSAHLNDTQTNISSAKSLSLLELPVLDLYLKADNHLVDSSLKLRKKFVNQELKSNFRQMKIYNTRTGYYPSMPLIKAINGWLKSIGW